MLHNHKTRICVTKSVGRANIALSMETNSKPVTFSSVVQYRLRSSASSNPRRHIVHCVYVYRLDSSTSQNKMGEQLEYNVCFLFHPVSRARAEARAAFSVKHPSHVLALSWSTYPVPFLGFALIVVGKHS